MPRIRELELASSTASLDRHLHLDPVVNQVPLAFLEGVRRHPERYPLGVRAIVAMNGDETIGVAMQRLPHDPIVARCPEEIAERLGSAFGERFSDIGGAHGPESLARAFARGAGASNTDLRVKMRQGLHRLDTVMEIPEAPGRARTTGPDDAAVLQNWLQAFAAEAVPDDPAPEDEAGERLATSGRCWIWEREDGTPVSFVNNIRRIPGLWAISPVYTPPEHRGHGYASSAVAFLSRYALAQGAEACTLFTDLANPTSNRIYERIGYRRIDTFTSLGWT